jgi:poly-gamma-glutamate capsule biosynthesis protein CapA/YwtB (metallophosphatase superfamily)
VTAPTALAQRWRRAAPGARIRGAVARSAALVTFGALVLAGCATSPREPAGPDTEPAQPVAVDADQRDDSVDGPGGPPAGAMLTLAAVGDIMLGTDYPDDRLAEDDGAGYLAAAAPLLLDADVAFGNLEGVLLDGGEPEKICSGTCYVFRSPSRYARHLAAAGFDLISLANNHARDFGETGRDSTMAALDAAGIAHSGRIGDVARVERNGLQVAMIAFAPNPGSHSLLELELAVAEVAALAAENDIVIVSVHGGGEGIDALHVPFGMETYLGEDRGDLRGFARAVIDAGADIVVGHGPHVPRGLEVYDDRLIAYSLGNFATYYGISVAGIKGLAPLLRVELDGEGRFVTGTLISMRQVRPRGPAPDASGEALSLMRRLSEADFGDSAPHFAAEGTLLPAAPER